MTPLHLLITALVRLLGLYFVIRAMDNAAVPFFSLMMQASMLPNIPEYQLPNPWTMFLPMVGFYIGLSALLFFAAPRIARVMIGSTAEVKVEVHWHETLLFSTGALIVAWAFVRLTDTAYSLVASAASNDGRYSIDDAMMTFIFLTVILLLAGALLIVRLHKISRWIAKGQTPTDQQTGAGQPATRPVVEPEGGDKPLPEAEGRPR